MAKQTIKSERVTEKGGGGRMRDRQTDRDRETYRWQNNQTKAKEFQRREGGGERMRDRQTEIETER